MCVLLLLLIIYLMFNVNEDSGGAFDNDSNAVALFI